MDSIKAEKFKAMKKYRKSQFLHTLLHLLAGLTCSLFFSNPFWFPSLCSSMKQFFLISLPCIWSSFFNPKCLFIVVNVIVIYLVGESGLVGPNRSPARDIYNEYMERSRSLRGVSVSTPQEKIRQPPEKRVEEVEKEAELKVQVNSKEEDEELVEIKEIKLGGKEEKEEEKEVEVNEVITSEAKEAQLEDRVEEETSEIGEEEAYKENEREIIEEEVGLPADELNKRVEEFIARVNKQRWLEAQLLVCCKA